MSSSVRNYHIDLQRHTERNSTPYHEVVAALAVKYSKDGDAILDIGTGAGNVPLNIAASGANRFIDVADAYQDCLRVTSQRVHVRETYLIDERDFDVARRIPASSYAVVTMSHVLEHLRDPVRGLTDAMKLSQPGGHLVVAVPNPVRPAVIVKSLMRKPYSNKGHVVAWDRSHWINFLENILRVEVVEYASDAVAMFPDSWGAPFRRIERRAVRALPWWSNSHVAVIRRPVTDQG